MKIGFVSLLAANLEIFRFPVMRTLVEQGHEVVAFLPEQEPSSLLEEAGIKVIPYRLKRSSLNPVEFLASLFSLKRVLQKVKPDVVHSFAHKPNILTALAGKLSGISKVICSVTGLGSHYISTTFRSKLIRSVVEGLYRFVAPFCDHVVFQNVSDRDYFCSMHIFAEEKTCIIPGSGIDTNKWRPQDEKKPLQVYMVSRLIQHKGVEDFLDAAAIIHSSLPEVEFSYIGWSDSGNSYSLPENIFEKYPMVQFLGRRNDVRELLSTAALVILPSHREGMSRSLMEAISLGKPVISCDVPGCRELIDEGLNGYLVNINAPEQIAEKAKSLLENDELRASFGKHSRQKAVTEFDVATIVEQHLRLYQLSKL